MNLPGVSQDLEDLNVWEKLKQDCKSELEQAKKELKDSILTIHSLR